MALVEIYPNNRSDKQFSENHFNRHRSYNDCMEWHDEGNEIVVILDTETNTEAVYERLGGVLCLDERFGIYCNVGVDDEWMGHNDLIRKMLVQEAMVEGFPEKCPFNDSVTWRQPKATEKYELYFKKVETYFHYETVEAEGQKDAERIAQELVESEDYRNCIDEYAVYEGYECMLASDFAWRVGDDRKVTLDGKQIAEYLEEE